MALWRHPGFTGDRWWDCPMTPSTIFDQSFGSGIMNDTMREMQRMERMMDNMAVPYWSRPSRRLMTQDMMRSGLSEVKNEKDKFAINLDVRHFAPEEITVKTADNNIMIEGKHEERPDEHGLIQRHFVRKYMLPKEVDAKAIVSKLSNDGILTIEAPKMALEGPKETVIPIQAAPAIEAKKK